MSVNIYKCPGLCLFPGAKNRYEMSQMSTNVRMSENHFVDIRIWKHVRLALESAVSDTDICLVPQGIGSLYPPGRINNRALYHRATADYETEA